MDDILFHRKLKLPFDEDVNDIKKDHQNLDLSSFSEYITSYKILLPDGYLVEIEKDVYEIKKKNFRKKISELFQLKDTYVFIVLNGFTKDILEYLFEEINKEYYSRIMLSEEIALRIPYNIMQPKFSIASKKDFDYLKKYQITTNSLPIILYSDPVRRWFDWKENCVIRCDREGDVYYRIVKK